MNFKLKYSPIVAKCFNYWIRLFVAIQSLLDQHFSLCFVRLHWLSSWFWKLKFLFSATAQLQSYRLGKGYLMVPKVSCFLILKVWASSSCVFGSIEFCYKTPQLWTITSCNIVARFSNSSKLLEWFLFKNVEFVLKVIKKRLHSRLTSRLKKEKLLSTH